MIEIPFWFAEALFALVWLAVRIVIRIRRGHIDWKREAVLLLWFVNLAVMIRFTFFPMARVLGRVQPLRFEAAAAYPFKVNLVPFVNLFVYESRRELLLNVMGNTAMFIPSGIVLPIVFKKLDSFWKVLLAGAALSLIIELLQLPFFERTSDADDLILNTLGVAIGYAIYALVRKLRRNGARRNDGQRIKR